MKTFVATLMGIAFILGTGVRSQAICLFDCGTDVEVEAKGAGRDIRENSDNVSGAKAEGIGNTAVQDLNLNGDGSVIVGTSINSGNTVSVWSNGGDLNVSSGNNIIGTMNDNSVTSNINSNNSTDNRSR